MYLLGFQAGLLSAVTSAFIILVDSQLRPDPGDETAALLRVLIYKVDNTTFGDHIPALPRWNGPPPAIVHVQILLFASFAASLFSAFLAMLGKQWLNRYASIDTRGTSIERGKDRQKKLDGIVAWYFNHVMESLPLMLQAALLLLGCALSRYLLDINVPVASVVLAVTAFGVIFYLFVVVAGAASERCPYQTPGSYALRYLGQKVWEIPYSTATHAIASTLSKVFEASLVIRTVRTNTRDYHPWWSRSNIILFLIHLVIQILCALAGDILSSLGAAIWVLGMSFTRFHSLFLRAYYKLRKAYFISKQRSNLRATALDLRCILWMLQTSLDKAVHLSALKHLASIQELAYFDPILVIDCWRIFTSCINIYNHRVVIQGLEQLAEMSARAVLRTLLRLSAMDPTSSVLVELRTLTRPFGLMPEDSPLHSMTTIIHSLARGPKGPQRIQWNHCRLSCQEHITDRKSVV